MRGPKQNLGPIGSAVLTFIGYQTNRQTDTQAKFMFRSELRIFAAETMKEIFRIQHFLQKKNWFG